MRNKLEQYISLGSQIKHTPRLTAPQTPEQGYRLHEPTVATEWHLGRTGWTDAQLAALVADVRKQESKCTSDFVTMDFPAMTDRAIMDEVNHAVTPWSRHHMREICAVTPVHYREAVEVETVKQGDKVFMSGDPTARTVLYAHVSPLFVSFTVISHEDAMPYLIHRHRGALIYKEVK